MSPSPFRLVGTLEGRPLRHDLAEGCCLIGRATDCDLRLPVEAVSRRHAQVVVGQGRVLLRDLGSRNGTLLNGKRAEGEVQVVPGDWIDVAGVPLQLLGGEREETVVFAAPETISASEELTWEESRTAPLGGAGTSSRLFPVVAEAGELLARPVEPDDLCEPIMDLVERALSPDRIFVMLAESEGGEPVIRASRLRGARPGDGLLMSRTLLDRVVSQQRSFLTADALSDPLLRAQESIVAMGVHSAMAAPMFDNQRVIGVLYVDSSNPLRRYARDELRALTLLANVVAVAITNARHRALEQQRRRLEAELETARRLLERILPAAAPPCPGWDLAFRLEPCFEVAGDLYDVRPLADGRLLLLVGDVAGKGLGAALTVVQILSLTRLLADGGAPLDHLLDQLNDQLFQTTDAERFATLFVGVLAPDSGRLVYINAGHEPPALLRSDGALQELASTAPLVGAFPGVPFVTAEVDLRPGDLLLLYTDGVTETNDARQDEYGRERLHACLREAAGGGPAPLLDSLLVDLAAFRGEAEIGDDVTALALRRAPA